MADGSDAAEFLDRLTRAADAGPQTGAPAEPARFDGLDLRAETLGPVALARTPPPPWWDTTHSRVALDQADFRRCSLLSVNLTGVALERADFTEAELASGVLRDALLGGAVFDRALLEDADLGGSHLRFASFRETVLEGAKLRGADLWGAKLPEADVDKTDFRDAQLEEADFRDADARDVDFRGAKLGLADFRGTDLRGSDFRGCVPRATKFDGADLRRANLEQLDLTNCSLRHVRLSDARLDRTRFHRDQLGGAIGEELAGEYELARRGYLSLERNFTDIGDPEASGWAYRRRRRMQKLDTRRRAAEAFRERHWGQAVGLGLSYANLKLVELVCDYGESVPRVLGAQLAVFVAFAVWYAAAGVVVKDVKDGDAPPGSEPAREVTRSPVDVVRYSLMALIAPGNPPEDLHPADDLTQLVTLSESFLGIFLTGLLGFVAGNRIRR